MLMKSGAYLQRVQIGLLAPRRLPAPSTDQLWLQSLLLAR